jgi:hypothetical protein
MLTRAEAEGYILSRIDAYRAAADFLPIFRRVAEEFDGKCYNCRFGNALREAASDSPLFLRVDKGTGYHSKAQRIAVSCIFSDPKTRRCNYGESYTIAVADLIDNKRIDYKALMESARSQRESNLMEAAKLEDSLSHVDEWKQQLDYLKHQINTIVGKIPYCTADAFCLYYTVRN